MTISDDFVGKQIQSLHRFFSSVNRFCDFVSFLPSSNNHRLASVTNTAHLYPEFSEGSHCSEYNINIILFLLKAIDNLVHSTLP